MPAKTGTYSLIDSSTLGSAQSSVTFSNIPQTYTDLLLVANIGATASNSTYEVQFNSDTGSNYSHTRLYGDGTNPASDRAANQTAAGVGFVGSASAGTQISYIQDYSNTTTFKTVLGRASVAGTITMATVSLWRNTNAITSILVKTNAGISFPSGSTFKLYGIEAGNL